MQWETVIGLETHIQLKTQSKIFSGASTTFGAEPNTQASAIDLGLPGVLPVLNAEAVRCAILFGLAVNGSVAKHSIFARKNYFYPDLPKGYQISQYELPIVQHGFLTIALGEQTKTIHILRAHLEEDAGKSVHDVWGNMSGIDLNRAGTALLEIVTEPDMRSAEEAVTYAKKLHELVQWIGICDGNMQEGSFRCDVNVSVRPQGSSVLGTRREIKNLNSFKFMQQAIMFESAWQIEQLLQGKAIVQATVLFDTDSGETRAMRSKEEAHDYRYFPDPDLLPLELDDDTIVGIQAQLPELPEVLQQRWMNDYGLSQYDAELLIATRASADYFMATVQAGASPKLVANWLLGSSAKLNAEEKDLAQIQLAPETLAQLLHRIADGTLSNHSAKQVFEALWSESAHQSPPSTVDAVIERLNLKQESNNDALLALVSTVLANQAAMVAEFKAGKEKAFNALVGQVMKLSQGRANPSQVSELLRKVLESTE